MTQRRELTEVQEAMLEHMAYLNYSEHRPASWQDFALFELSNKQYRLSYGTIRNHFLHLKRIGKIKLEYQDINSYYSLVECAMTTNQASVTASKNRVNSTTSRGDLAALIDRMPFDTPAIHDIHLSFHSLGLWDSLSLRSVSVAASAAVSDSPLLTKILPRCKDIILPEMDLDVGIKALITVHKTDVAIVRIACSKNPLYLDIEVLLYLNRALVRVQEKLLSQTYNLVQVPDADTWTITMWHLGRDSLQRYDGEKFHITLQEFNGELLRAYSKARRIRIEAQQSFLDIRLGDVIKKKLRVGAGV